MGPPPKSRKVISGSGIKREENEPKVKGSTNKSVCSINLPVFVDRRGRNEIVMTSQKMQWKKHTIKTLLRGNQLIK